MTDAKQIHINMLYTIIPTRIQLGTTSFVEVGFSVSGIFIMLLTILILQHTEDSDNVHYNLNHNLLQIRFQC